MNNDLFLPHKANIESSSACQLKCPSCPTSEGFTKKNLGLGFLKIDDFIYFVEKNPYIKEIELSNYGEAFLNNDLLDIFESAYSRKIQLTLYNGVNLNDVSEKLIEGLVKYQVQGLTCSIDGLTQETYSKYRIKGKIEKVFDNIEKINFYKHKYKSNYPLLRWQFIVFGHNEHEIEMVKKKAKELNMSLYFKKTWDDKFSPIKNHKQVMKETGWDTSTRDEYLEKNKKDYMNTICYQLWNNPQINFDGKFLGCCRNFWSDFGENAFSKPLSEILKGEKIIYAKKMLTGKKPEREDIPCTTCSIYTTMKDNNSWINIFDIHAKKIKSINVKNLE